MIILSLLRKVLANHLLMIKSKCISTFHVFLAIYILKHYSRFFLLFTIWYVKIFEVHMFTCPLLAVVLGCYSKTNLPCKWYDQNILGPFELLVACQDLKMHHFLQSIHNSNSATIIHIFCAHSGYRVYACLPIVIPSYFQCLGLDASIYSTCFFLPQFPSRFLPH